MYEFHYNVILKKYGDKAQLLFTDTDSLCYEITTGDLNNDFEKVKNYFDFSDYPKDHSLYSDENKKKIGYFKDELNGQPCFEFVGLSPALKKKSAENLKVFGTCFLQIYCRKKMQNI
ncbi:hypothetical protein AVEN_198612-1 [Araneus ventricosus]|uniref:DNA-directed DNA polymerase n=1 Tax=Araneus ventricosus TaxID=182803 RepID=A0A4Y2NU44_ARAVE|nr:hypothetical protein AVEN_198612-1 [Araneus ventricosus]